MKKIHIATMMLVVAPFLQPTIHAQDRASEQLWLEYLLNYPFANVYNIENAFTYSTNLGSDKWRELDYAPTLERSFTRHIDGMVGLTFAYVWQNDTTNTFEIRPMIGTRIHFTPNNRVLTRLLIRYEQRFLQNTESRQWERSSRTRLRMELIIPLNRKSYSENKQWYAMADAEWFFVLDQDLIERFAGRFRLRIGCGYRLNAAWRFEVLYVQQEARNKIGEDFYTSDHIVRARAKYYINRKKDQG